MIKIYSEDKNLSFEKLPENAKYCSVSAFNVVNCAVNDIKKGNLLPPKMFNFYLDCVKNNSIDLIKGQDAYVLASSCDENGLRLFDHAIILGNFDFFRFLLDNTSVAINTIPFGLKETAISYVLNNFSPSLDDKIIEHAKIVCLLLKEGGLAYSLEDFKYDENFAEENNCDGFDCKHDNSVKNTLKAVTSFLDNCVDELGISEEKDVKLLKAIDIFARTGFLLSPNARAHNNYAKYNLSKLFSLEKRGNDVSYILASTITEYNNYYADFFQEEFEEKVFNANIIAGTYASPSNILRRLGDSCEFVDVDAETDEADCEADISNSPIGYDFQVEIEKLIDKCRDGLSREQYDAEVERIANSVGKSSDELKELIIDEFGDDYFAPADLKDLEGAELVDDNELELDSEEIGDFMKAVFDHMEIEYDEETDIEFEYDEETDAKDANEALENRQKFGDNCAVLTKYTINELRELAKKNPNYIEESPVLEKLYSNKDRFETFKKEVEEADLYYNLCRECAEREMYLKRQMAKRNDDSVDDMLYSTDKENEEESIK